MKIFLSVIDSYDEIMDFIFPPNLSFFMMKSQGAQALICISVVCFSVYLFYESKKNFPDVSTNILQNFFRHGKNIFRYFRN